MARKDLEGVLRNLYCFLEILQKSRSDEVSNWDKQSMSHALKWAAFADQASDDYMHIKSRSGVILVGVKRIYTLQAVAQLTFIPQSSTVCGYVTIRVRYAEGPLFWKFIIRTNPKADSNPNSNPKPKPNVSTVAHICTVDFQNSGPLE